MYVLCERCWFNVESVIQKGDTMLLTVEDLERESQISRHTWRLWLKQNKLQAVRLGRRVRVERSEYERFVADNRSEARQG